MDQSQKHWNEDAEVASTVTNLISKLPGSNISKKTPAAMSCVGIYGDEAFYSSSKLLRKYLRDHDKNQTWDLAKVLTDEIKFRNKNFSETSAFSSSDKENEISKEIKLAKKLLGNKCVSENDDVRSLTTDDLLTSNPFGVHSETKSQNYDDSLQKSSRSITHSEFDGNKRKMFSGLEKHSSNRESTRSLHFSHFGSSRNMNTPLSKMESESSLSETSDASTMNLFSLNGTSYTPHKVKYKSLSKDLKSSLERKTLNRSNCSCPQDRSDQKCSSSTLTSLLLHQPKTPNKSQNFTAFAGQTPFRTRNGQILTDCDSTSSPSSSIQDSSLIETDFVKFPTKSNSIDSQSHISVPLRFEDTKSDVQQFIKQCLDEDYGNDMPIKPGSVETLKNMIFTLQSMSSHENEDDGMDECCPIDDINSNSQVMDGHSSLRRAMSHLSNLRNLTEQKDI